MNVVRLRRMTCITFTITLCVSFLVLPSYETALSNGENINSGPFVDRTHLIVIDHDDLEVLALLNNEIDLIGYPIDTSFMPQLEQSENIEVKNQSKNGHSYLTINCAKYPLNVTSLRRAIAFAMDKVEYCEEVWDGFAIPSDAFIPSVNPFSAEIHLDYSYYLGEIEIANQLLDDAGFFDIDSDDVREAPDGSEFDILLEVASTSPRTVEVGEAIVDTLHIIGINVSLSEYYTELQTRLYFHGDYDIALRTGTFRTFDIDWMAFEFWSEYADEPYWNVPNFRNSTFDSWREQLLHSVDYDEVLEASIEMQRVLMYECPVIVCYEDLLFSAHRTDRFEGFVSDTLLGVSGRWSTYKAHLKTSAGGPNGGTFRKSVPFDAYWPNFMMPIDPPSFGYRFFTQWDSMLLYNEPWLSLFVLNPEGLPHPWLVESYTIETHDDNNNVPVGNTRFTFNIFQNASWSDGNPITAEDVAFTFNFYREGPENPMGTDLNLVTASYALNDYTCIIEFLTESYWNLKTIAYKPIIPQHIFTEIGAENWSQWEPNPLEEAMVISGPFNYTDYIEGEYTELSVNPLYFLRPTPTQSITNRTTSPVNLPAMTTFVIAGVSVVVILVIVAKWKRDV